jgi:hypothetical protein
MKKLDPESAQRHIAAAKVAWRAAGMPESDGRLEWLRRRGHSVIMRIHTTRGLPVIAKRSKTHLSRLEQTIYERILAPMPVPTIRCYGSSRDECPEHRWLFLEDAGEEAYSAEEPGHLALADRWLAQLHQFASDPAWAPLLPDAGPTRYLQHLEKARRCLREGMNNNALGQRDVAYLNELVEQLDRLMQRWQLVEACCRLMPETLVHGDFVAKNLRVRSGGNGLVLLPLDWETAGWGCPAADLDSIHDLKHYHAAIHSRLEFSDLLQVARCGTLFRLLASIDWSSRGLRYEWVERPMSELGLYGNQLNQVLRDLEWSG